MVFLFWPSPNLSRMAGAFAILHDFSKSIDKVSEKRMKLIELPIMEALLLKSEKGRLAKGRRIDQPFDGDPLLELFEECLDAMNYCKEAILQGIDLGHRRQDFMSIAIEVQRLFRDRERKTKLPEQRPAVWEEAF